jgi:hypothetical protein
MDVDQDKLNHFLGQMLSDLGGAASSPWYEWATHSDCIGRSTLVAR